MIRWLKEWTPAILTVLVVGGGVVWWNGERGGDGDGPLSRPSARDRERSCGRLSGTPEERLKACLDEVPRSKPGEAASNLLADLAGSDKLFVVANLDPGFEVLRMGDVAGLEAMLLADDEHAVAKALRDAGVRGVVVHRDLTGALDRDDAVLARLAHHDFLEWFQLRRVTSDLVIYTVRTSPSKIPVATADDLLQGLRARLEHRPLVPAQRWDPETVRLIGVLRLQGTMLASRHVVFVREKGVDRPTLERALDDLAVKLEREWERKVEIEGHGRLAERLDELRLEVHVVMEKAAVEPRSRFEIFDLWEMGVDGMMFRQREPEEGEELDEKFTYMPGSELVTRSLHSGDEFLRVAVKEFGWNDTRPWEKDPRTQLDLVRTQHFMEAERGGGPAVRLVRGMPEVPMDWVTDKRIQDMLIAGGEWWLANQSPEGKFEYKWWPEQNRSSTDYNEVRHILGARDLADVWRYRRDPRYLDGARRSMDWLLRYEVDATQAPQGPLPHPPAGTALFRFPSYRESTPTEPVVQKLGTTAVALLGWVAWAEATGSHAEDERIRKMARFVQSMQEADGRFAPYYVQPGHPYEHERNDIVPGEAMLALGRVAEYFGDNTWVGDRYDKFAEYYQKWFRTRAERRVPWGRWPHDIYANQDRLDLVQFGPWSVMAAAQIQRITGNPAAGAFGLEVADWMIDSYLWSAEKTPWPDYAGGYYKLPEELPAMQTFCYAEGTAAAYALAARSAPERKGKYESATHQSIRFLEIMQFDELDSYFASRPEKIRGGIKYTMNEEKVRIDYVGHGLSTLSQFLAARVEDRAVTREIWDPADLERLAGNPGSVPGQDWSKAPPMLPSGEWAWTTPEPTAEDPAAPPPPEGTLPAAPAPEEEPRDRERDDRGE